VEANRILKIFFHAVPMGCMIFLIAARPAVSHPPSATSSMQTIAPEPTPTEITQSIPALTATPSSSGAMQIGTSVAGRSMEVYRFGTGSVEKLIVYGIHGGSEYNTVQLATQTIADLKAHPERIPIDVSLYLVPVLNPDGVARAHGPEGRANDHGVDLNRNWNNLWKPDWKRNGCWSVLPISAGTYPLSEPEARSLWRLIAAHHFEEMISYHSAAMGILPAGQPLDPASVRLAQAVANGTDRKDYPYPPLNSGCEYTGQLSDWASTLGIAFIDLELPDHTNTDFAANLKILQIFLLWRK
jgi:hypothetical protein